MHLSIVAPVPEAHLSFIEVIAVLVDASIVANLFAEQDDFGVLAPQLNHAAHVGMQAFNGQA